MVREVIMSLLLIASIYLAIALIDARQGMKLAEEKAVVLEERVQDCIDRYTTLEEYINNYNYRGEINNE